MECKTKKLKPKTERRRGRPKLVAHAKIERIKGDRVTTPQGLGTVLSRHGLPECFSKIRISEHYDGEKPDFLKAIGSKKKRRS